jgi:NAD-dependent SIR2 family protein deacetylase
LENCNDEIWENKEKIEIDMESFRAKDIIRCKYCNKTARVNILMFNDWGWNSQRVEEQERRFREWRKSLKTENKRLAIIEIGAGSAIPTVRNLSNRMSKNYDNSNLIRINPRESEVYQDKDISLALGGLEALTKILD